MTDINLQIIEKFKPLFERDKVKFPYVVLVGGRNSTKSWAASQYVVLQAAAQKKRVVCCREIHKSIEDSSYSLLVNTIDRMNINHCFNAIKGKITGVNGSKFTFHGLKTNVSSLKSLEGADICIVEEAENVSEDSWAKLLPTIRKEGSEVIVIFNPDHEEDATYVQWITNPPPGTIVIESTYLDNPWLTDKSKNEIEHMKETDYNQFLNVFMGEPLGNDDLAIIKPEWFASAIDAHKKLNFEPEGFEQVGFDPMDGGSDKAGLTYRHGSVILDLKEDENKTLEECTKDAYKYSKDKMITNLCYDSIGVGVGSRVQFNALDPQKKINIIGFDARHSASKELYKGEIPGNKYFRNRRSEEYFKLADRFRLTHLAVTKGNYINPDELISISSDIDKGLIKQLKYEATHIREKANSNFKQIESKKDMSDRGVKSPNLLDSVVYAYVSMPTAEDDFEEIDFAPTLW